MAGVECDGSEGDVREASGDRSCRPWTESQVPPLTGFVSGGNTLETVPETHSSRPASTQSLGGYLT